MYHICYSNPEAWQISYRNGVYGNVSTGNESTQVFWGKLIDLVAIAPGDKVFFYVKTKMCLYGIFEVVNSPYYCENDLFEDDDENYPFRFNFKEIRHFENPIPVSELASLIENGYISSITTFDRDSGSGFRGIRQLTNDEGKILEDNLYKLNPKGNPYTVLEYDQLNVLQEVEATYLVKQDENYFTPTKINFTSLAIEKLRKNKYVSRYENSLQGYIYYCLRNNLNNIVQDLGLNNFSEVLMEVPLLKAQQFRSDILCIYRNSENTPHFYSIIETKRKAKINIENLSQLIGYMKTFSLTKQIPFNSIEGVYISDSFEEATVNYLRNRRNVEKENPIRLIEYSIDENGFVSFNQIEI